MKNLNKAEVLSMEQLDIVTGGATFDPIDILKKELDKRSLHNRRITYVDKLLRIQ